MDWRVEIDSEAEQKMRADFTKGLITQDDILVIKKWYSDMAELGPDRLIEMRKYDDHHLDGNWSGYRAACFSPAGRIIYKVIEKKVMVFVVRVTPDHNYKR